MARGPGLHEILRMLHISVITEKVDRPQNMIRERWVTPTYVPADYPEFCKIITGYYQYHMQAWLGGPAMPVDIAFTQARALLEKGQGGYIQMAKCALGGREGSIIAAIDQIAAGIKDQATEAWTGYVLGTFVNPLDYDSKLAIMQSYLREFSHVLPGEKLMSAYELASNFDAFIKFHLQWINTLRKAVL